VQHADTNAAQRGACTTRFSQLPASRSCCSSRRALLPSIRQPSTQPSPHAPTRAGIPLPTAALSRVKHQVHPPWQAPPSPPPPSPVSNTR
jgi:hypothetical protein